MGSETIRRMTSAQGGGLHHSVLTRIGADLTTGRLAAGDVFSICLLYTSDAADE